MSSFDPVLVGTSAFAIAILLNRRWLIGVGRAMAGVVDHLKG
jgi:hypothetical protein